MSSSDTRFCDTAGFQTLSYTRIHILQADQPKNVKGPGGLPATVPGPVMNYLRTATNVPDCTSLAIVPRICAADSSLPWYLTVMSGRCGG